MARLLPEAVAHIAGTPEMITQQQAVEIAKNWAEKLFSMDVSGLKAFVSLEDGTFWGSDSSVALWRVRFGPGDMLVRENGGDYAYDRCEF